MTRDEIPEPAALIFGFWRRVLHSFESHRVEDHENDKYLAAWQLTFKTEPDADDGGYTAWIEELPGCVSDGATEEEALENLAEAMQGVIAERMAQAPVVYYADDNDTKVTTRQVAFG